MSTYLVAFVIGNYDFVEKIETENNTLVRVYTPVGKSNLGQFSLDVS
jgi:puromycin-sensitive aminopeptidase